MRASRQAPVPRQDAAAGGEASPPGGVDTLAPVPFLQPDDQRVTSSVPGDARITSIVAWLGARLSPGARLVTDSRALRPGDAFLGWPGGRVDGRRFVPGALAAGAAAALVEADEGVDGEAERPADAPVLPVPDLRRLAGPIAAAWHGEPTRTLSVVAVTGTNGKTSCSQWIAQSLARGGRPCGVVGTLGAGLWTQGEGGGATCAGLDDFGLTTPDAPTLQRLFADLLARGAQAAAIEASSIGLHQHRLDGTRIRTAVFTNLTRDHLDYHGDMAAYARAKAMLFAWPGLENAVLNLDDAAAGTMRAALAPGVRCIGYRVEARATGAVDTTGVDTSSVGWAGMRDALPDASPTQADAPVADRLLRATRVAALPEGTEVEIDGDWGRATPRLSLLGRHNVENALAVLGALLAEGLPFADAVSALQSLQPVPGRLQKVDVPGGAALPLVVVDYAHTPDALARALEALAPVAAARGGRLWCVFGAGGDRDPGKRPLMGAVASRGADAVVLTSDNPRGEDPEAILDAIEAGLDRPAAFRDADRRAAIGRAVREAGPRDLLLLAGKGHEDYQEIAGTKRPFSDIEVARSALARRAREGG